MGTLTIFFRTGSTEIKDVALDAVQSWIDRTNKWAIVTGYTFNVIY